MPLRLEIVKLQADSWSAAAWRSSWKTISGTVRAHPELLPRGRPIDWQTRARQICLVSDIDQVPAVRQVVRNEGAMRTGRSLYSAAARPPGETRRLPGSDFVTAPLSRADRDGEHNA